MSGHEADMALAGMTRRGFLVRAGAGAGERWRWAGGSSHRRRREARRRDEPDDVRPDVPGSSSRIAPATDRVRANLIEWGGRGLLDARETTSRARALRLITDPKSPRPRTPTTPRTRPHDVPARHLVDHDMAFPTRAPELGAAHGALSVTSGSPSAVISDSL